MKSKTLLIFSLFLITLSSCIPAATSVPPTETVIPTSTFTTVPATSTSTSTSAPSLTPTNSSCQLPIRGTYNFSSSNVVFNMVPGKHMFFNKPGGGKYSNDQASCELNYDCTQVRAINKDSAEPNPAGVIGPWVDVQTETSSAKWSEYIVTCSLGN